MLDETPPQDAAPVADAAEREEQVWFDEERERLDDKRRSPRSR